MSESLAQLRQQKDDFFKRHPQSPIPANERANFSGLSYYPYNPDLSLELEAEIFSDQAEIMMQTTTGDLRPFLRWGRVNFEVEGQKAALTLYYNPQHDSFFLPFADATSGAETYGAGRYLDPERLDERTFEIDFNLAYHPYCAYNEAYSCPLPPSENRLSVAISAGERLPESV